MKQITLTAEEIDGNMQFSCTYSETEGSCGTVQVNDSLVASHSQAIADAHDVFAIEKGMLKVTTSTGNGTDYALKGNVLTVNNGFTGSITATYEFTASAMRDIYFEYDHNGMRTQKKVVENGVTTTYDYILHGKLITHMTKKVNGVLKDTLHFFCDVQSCHNNTFSHYIHNPQRNITGIFDTFSNLAVVDKGTSCTASTRNERQSSRSTAVKARHYRVL